jgi:hypothetical protein
MTQYQRRGQRSRLEDVLFAARPQDIPSVCRISARGKDVALPVDSLAGYMLVEGKRTALPIGSTLKQGVLYWQLGPGCLGDYLFELEKSDGTMMQVSFSVRPAASAIKRSDR